MAEVAGFYLENDVKSKTQVSIDPSAPSARLSGVRGYSLVLMAVWTAIIILLFSWHRAEIVGNMMELARVLSARPSKRTIRFAAFAAEETGLYGSTHYAELLARADRKDELPQQGCGLSRQHITARSS